MVKVSVIIPTFNNEKDIEQCIKSILNQSYSDFEIIIVDDASTDNTLSVLEKYYKNDKIKIFKNDSNRKAAYTRNRAISESQGEYITVQDADDYSVKTRLQKQIEFLERNLAYSFVGSNAFSYDKKGIWKKTKLKSAPSLDDFRNKSLPFVHGSITFRKSILQKLQGYADVIETERGQDSDLLHRIYLDGNTGYNLDESLYYYQETLDTVRKRSFKHRYRGIKRKLQFYPWKTLSKREKYKIIRSLFIGLLPPRIWFAIMKYLGKKTLKEK